MTRILTVTLNPALDVTTGVPRLVEGAKMRCEPPTLDPGGGGANVSRALAKFGHESRCFIAVGGAIGLAYRGLVERDAGLHPVWFEAKGDTRQSLAVHDREGGGQYRFVLPGEPWSDDDGRRALAELEGLMEAGDLVVLSGSQPPGLPDDFAARLCRAAQGKGARLILDTSGPALAHAARPDSCAHVLRMDRHEAAELLGRTRIDLSAAEELARDLVARRACNAAIVTVGGDGAVGATAEGAWHVRPPKVEVTSSTGAGDSFVAGLTARLAEGRAFPEALAFAAAAAASAVQTDATELCSAEGTEAALAGVIVQTL